MSAAEITLSPLTPACSVSVDPACLMTTGSDTANPDSDDFEVLFPGLTFTGVYKQNADDASDTGLAAGWYTTVFTEFADVTVDPPQDPSGAVITWAGEPAGFIGAPTYLVVKDGNAVPAWYLFDISNWGGKDTLTVTGFWPGDARGSISHVEIFGTPVPDGGSVAMLLGLGLIGLAGIRRFLK